jgi:putative FmdB family regulatory protein
MPLHDFTCRRCAHTFEALVRPGSAATCPSCGAPDPERHPSSFAVSSPGLRRAHLDAARQRAERQRQARRHEEHQHMRKHLHDDQ